MTNMSRDGAATHRDDVEGHKKISPDVTVELDDDLDVEGHRKAPGAIDDRDDEVEGHAKKKN